MAHQVPRTPFVAPRRARRSLRSPRVASSASLAMSSLATSPPRSRPAPPSAGLARVLARRRPARRPPPASAAPRRRVGDRARPRPLSTRGRRLDADAPAPRASSDDVPRFDDGTRRRIRRVGVGADEDELTAASLDPDALADPSDHHPLARPVEGSVPSSPPPARAPSPSPLPLLPQRLQPARGRRPGGDQRRRLRFVTFWS